MRRVVEDDPVHSVCGEVADRRPVPGVVRDGIAGVEAEIRRQRDRLGRCVHRAGLEARVDAAEGVRAALDREGAPVALARDACVVADRRARRLRQHRHDGCDADARGATRRHSAGDDVHRQLLVGLDAHRPVGGDGRGVADERGRRDRVDRDARVDRYARASTGADPGGDRRGLLGRGGVDGDVATGVGDDRVADLGFGRLVHDLDIDPDPDAGRTSDRDRAGDAQQVGVVSGTDRDVLARGGAAVVPVERGTSADPRLRHIGDHADGDRASDPGARCPTASDRHEHDVLGLLGAHVEAHAARGLDIGVLTDRRLDEAVAEEDR